MFNHLPPNVRGMLQLTASSCIFTLSDTLMKLSTAYWPVSQSMSFRGVVAVLLSLGLVVGPGKLSDLRGLGNPLVLLRTVSEGLLALSFILALSLMPIADLTSILMLSPLVITAIVALFFGERVGWRRWSAIFVGFLGMLLVIQPGGMARPESYQFAVLLGLGAVAGVAARDLLTRKLEASVPSNVVMLASAIGGGVAGLLLAPIETWRPWAMTPAIALCGAAILVTAANYLLILACRGVDLSVVAPFRYSAVIFAIVMGALVFGEIPNPLAFAGMAVIVASGIYLMHRERVRRRRSGSST